jgi:hypothetical protein
MPNEQDSPLQIRRVGWGFRILRWVVGIAGFRVIHCAVCDHLMFRFAKEGAIWPCGSCGAQHIVCLLVQRNFPLFPLFGDAPQEKDDDGGAV